MSLPFRVVSMSKGVQRCISNFHFYKLNLQFLTSSNYCRCKTVTLSTCLRRNYSSKNNSEESLNKRTIDENENYSSKSDLNKKIIDGKEAIYLGFLSDNIRRIKILSLCTSCVGLGVQPLVYAKAVAANATNDFTLPVFALIAAFAIATPIALHVITKKYVLNIDYDHKENKYIATIYNLFARRKQIEFTPDDVTIPTVLGMFTTCAIKGHPVFIDSKGFTDQQHYIKIMGYDKPLNFRVRINNQKSNN